MLFCDLVEHITLLIISKSVFRYTVYYNVPFESNYDSKITCRYFKMGVFSY